MGGYMSTISHLYRITDQATGRFYIGKHVGQVQNGYLGSGLRWLRHIRKNKTVDLKYEVLVIADTKYILDLESRYVTLDLISQNPLCMNLKQGGMGGIGLSKESLESMKSKLRGRPSWNKGVPMSAETKAKLSAAKMGQTSPTKGRPMSDETRAKVSANRKGKGGWAKGVERSAEHRANLSAALKGRTVWNKGVKPTEDQLQKLRTAMLGKKHSKETKQKMGLAHKGVTHTDEAKAKISASHKALPRVICPHCETVGGPHAMKRWHFENCRKKGETT
jgi:hypothetical protein